MAGGAERVHVGSLAELVAAGRLVAKAGSHGVCVFWDGATERPCAVDDRCPHLGFPLHRGTVEAGILTCHWHHARFDLTSGGTLDPFADDVRAYPVELDGGEVYVVVGAGGDPAAHLRRRLHEGLEGGLTLVIAKSVLGLVEAGVPAGDIVRVGLEFGTTYRGEGWGAGLTVLVAMANLLPHLDPAERPLALVHGLAFVARDTRGRAPRFGLAPLPGGDVPAERLAAWYRRFVEVRSTAAAERALATAVAAGHPQDVVADMMLAAATDHAFLDGGHTLDFTNKAFEALDHVGWDAAGWVLPTLARQTALADRAEEEGPWRHPHDLAALVDWASERLAGMRPGDGAGFGGDAEVAALARRLWADDPAEAVRVLLDAAAAGASPEQLGRAVALAAALRVTRFHSQNDFGDWDVVHHGFTAANALHQALVRHPSPELARGLIHGALKVYLDRFLTIPAARLPEPGGERPDLGELQACWDQQGAVERAGAIAYGWLRAGGDPRPLVAALGRALLAEDAGFHWFQLVEAAVRQFHTWPEGSEEGALILAGAARFLAAHTPTRRELPQVFRVASRLRRGEELFERA